jgi:hypothetical protein
MDWTFAIRRNRDELLAVVAAIVALLGGREAAGGRIARGLRQAALALLRPAESAARRLIVIVARGLTVASRPAPALGFAGIAARAAAGGAGSPSRAPAFRLVDPPKRHAFRLAPVAPKGVPRIRTFWPPAALWRPAEPPRAVRPAPPPPDALADAARLRLRLAALERALADLPAQAKRLARWRARRLARGKDGPQPQRPLRIGRPPGWRERPTRDVDRVLRDCHALALDALRPDSS